MPRAIWEGVLAAAGGCVEAVEDNSYFPAEGLCMADFHPRETRTRCGRMGITGDAVRACCGPLPEAAVSKDMVAFRHGVEVRR